MSFMDKIQLGKTGGKAGGMAKGGQGYSFWKESLGKKLDATEKEKEKASWEHLFEIFLFHENTRTALLDQVKETTFSSFLISHWVTRCLWSRQDLCILLSHPHTWLAI